MQCTSQFVPPATSVVLLYFLLCRIASTNSPTLPVLQVRGDRMELGRDSDTGGQVRMPGAALRELWAAIVGPRADAPRQLYGPFPAQ